MNTARFVTACCMLSVKRNSQSLKESSELSVCTGTFYHINIKNQHKDICPPCQQNHIRFSLEYFIGKKADTSY